MKIAIFGASGYMGGAVAREALERGHTVTAIVHQTPLQLNHERLTAVTGDATDPSSVAAVVGGHDAVAVAIGGRKEANHDVVPAGARALLTGLPQAGVKRLVWVGAGGLLEVAPGVRLFDTPQFPAPYKAEMLAQAEALELFRANTDGVEWSFSCPPPGLYPGAEPGERTGQFRTGGDQLLTNEKGDSTISLRDYALAFLDELEHPAHIRQLFTVAY